MNSKTQKIEWIDTLKVITMLLVIIGHCGYLVIATPYGGTPYSYMDKEVPSLTYKLIGCFVSWIYTFHMPLFMAISGMCFSLSMRKNPSLRQLSMGKGKRLLVPFACVTLLYAVPIKYLSGYYDCSESVLRDIFVGQILLLGNSHLWYVASLFEVFVMYYLIERSRVRKNSFFWLVLLLVSWAGRFIEVRFNILGIGAAMKHLFFFALGYSLLPYLDKIKTVHWWKPVLGALMTFVLSLTSHYWLPKWGVTGKMMGYVMFTALAVIGGGSTLLLVKRFQGAITRVPLYEKFRCYTYELYLYSDPLNYPVIALTCVLFGTSIYANGLAYASMFVTRFVLTTIGAFVVIHIVKGIKKRIIS